MSVSSKTVLPRLLGVPRPFLSFCWSDQSFLTRDTFSSRREGSAVAAPRIPCRSRPSVRRPPRMRLPDVVLPWQALRSRALSRAMERGRAQQFRETSSRRTVKTHFAAWRVLCRVVQSHAHAVIKKTWAAWRKQLNFRQGLQVLETMQQHVYERQTRRCLVSFQGEVRRFREMQALSTELPWLGASLQEKVE